MIGNQVTQIIVTVNNGILTSDKTCGDSNNTATDQSNRPTATALKSEYNH